MFDKQKFCEIIKKALGDRTITEYSNESGVNRTYLSKYVNKRLDSAPSPDILKRLAEYAHNNVTYEDLMESAGYIVIKENENLNTDENKTINLVSEAKSKYLANPKNKKKKFLYELLKEMQEAGIINSDGNEILDDESAKLILEDIRTKVKLIKKLKETDNKQ